MKTRMQSGRVCLPDLVVAAALAVTVGCQGSPTTAQQEQAPPPSDASFQSTQPQQDDRGLTSTGDAYDRLQQVTLDTLKTEARIWTAPPRDGNGTTEVFNATLREDELLIAACPAGLLAGAPTDSIGGNAPRSDTSAAGGMDALGNADDNARTVGMLLVCAQPVGDVGGNDTARVGEHDVTPRSASAPTAGPLQPGVYAVQRSGPSVWLTDREGRVALRTTLAAPAVDAAVESRPEGAVDGSSERAADAREDASEWGQVFAAVAQAAMGSMGWSGGDGSVSTP